MQNRRSAPEMAKNHFGAGAPPIVVYFSGDWDVHWGYGLLTHGQMRKRTKRSKAFCLPSEAKPRRCWLKQGFTFWLPPDRLKRRGSPFGGLGLSLPWGSQKVEP